MCGDEPAKPCAPSCPRLSDTLSAVRFRPPRSARSLRWPVGKECSEWSENLRLKTAFTFSTFHEKILIEHMFYIVH